MADWQALSTSTGTPVSWSSLPSSAPDTGRIFCVAGRVLEQQVAVFARLPAAQREGVDGLQPVGQRGLAQVLIHAVAVEVDDVVGPSGRLGVGQFLLELLERGRAQGGDVEAGEVFAQVLQQPVGHRPQFDVVAAARPAHDVEQPDASLVGRRARARS